MNSFVAWGGKCADCRVSVALLVSWGENPFFEDALARSSSLAVQNPALELNPSCPYLQADRVPNHPRDIEKECGHRIWNQFHILQDICNQFASHLKLAEKRDKAHSQKALCQMEMHTSWVLQLRTDFEDQTVGRPAWIGMLVKKGSERPQSLS